MTLCIGHHDARRQIAVVDLIREVMPPFSPADAAGEFAGVLASYGVHNVVGDKFGGLWVAEMFARFSVVYKPTAEPKNLLYGSLLATINSRRVELLDHRKLVAQLIGLERKTSRSGRADQIDHAPGGHDDVCNAVAGCVATLMNASGQYDSSLSWVSDSDDPAKNWQALRTSLYLRSGGAMHLW